MSALLPEGPLPLVGLAVVAVGVALVLRRGVPKAYGLGLVMMGVFLLDIVGRLAGWGTVQAELGFRTSRLLAGEGWWTPFTYAFVHQAPGSARSFFSLHLVGNLFILLTAGPALEERVGERRFLVIFFAGALATLVVHGVLGFVIPQYVGLGSIALGASGAIFAVLTAFAVRYPREKLPILLLFFVFWLQASIVLLVYLGFNVAYMVGDYARGAASGIGWWGHFAGFFVGLAFAARLPDAPAAVAPKGSTKGLPDAQKLAPLATTPELKRILERIEQFTPEARTHHDTTFADAWLEKFFAKATCPQGHGFERQGLRATCAGGETSVDFAR